MTSTSTLIRIPRDVKSRLEAMTRSGESIGSVIGRIMDYYESAGSVNGIVNAHGNSISASVHPHVNDMLSSEIEALTRRVMALEEAQNKPDHYDHRKR